MLRPVLNLVFDWLKKRREFLIPCSQYAARIWKRMFHSENASNIFPSHFAGKIWKSNKHRSFWIGKLGQWSDTVIVTSSFSKSCIFKCPPPPPPPHTRTPRLVFSDCCGLKSVFKNLRFRDGLLWTVDLNVEINPRFQISPTGRWRLPVLTCYWNLNSFKLITIFFHSFSRNAHIPSLVPSPRWCELLVHMRSILVITKKVSLDGKEFL